MKNKILLVTLLFLHTLFSQKLSHPLRAENSSYQVSSIETFPDTLNVLSIQVQFQSDNDSRTSGNGQFDLTLSDERIIDAPPHDSAYFANHGLFAQNYFAKASNGKQHVRITVLSKVITLKKVMKDYAPVSGNLPLANLIDEAWKGADSLYPGFPFQQYELFTIFHAGVGKDIDLRAALGYDPTPLDLPSLYFNLNSLKSLFGNSYQGVILNNSSFKIPNSIILPETEVRRIPSVGSEFVLKLGINGLFVASIGSHLGLPDLFDTKSGKSGIGRFGLMDGQSIFSFSGIAPPEPSAWEKSYLGWTTPIEVLGNKSLNVPAVGLYSFGNDTIYKIPISAKEYYLVENRQRDAKNDGQTLTMQWKGQTILKTFTKDEIFFSNSNIDSAYGVVIDVDELDWSAPGLINANNSYKGGILVWHIDETIIEKNLIPNSINADPAKRGIDLEEADGSQDIGQTYDFGDPASGSEDGSPIDYWFSGNIFPNYKNEFSESTNPNSLSNTYAKSHVTLKNFSAQASRMTFEANVGSADVKLVKVIQRNNLKLNNNDAPTAADLNSDGKQELIYTSGDSIYVLNTDLTPYLSNSTGLFSTFGGRFQPTFTKRFAATGAKSDSVLVGIKDSVIIIFSEKDQDNNGLADIRKTISVGNMITSPLFTPDNNGSALTQSAFVGDEKGNVVSINQTNDSTYSVQKINYGTQPVRFLGVDYFSNYFAVTGDKVISNNSKTWDFSYTKILSMGTWYETSNDQSLDGFYAAVVTENNNVSILSYKSGAIKTFKSPDKVTGSYAIADIDGDNSVDVLIGTDKGLSAYSRTGILIEYFPIAALDKSSIFGSPTVLNLEFPKRRIILFSSSNGQIYAYQYPNKVVKGFPIQTGGSVSSPFFYHTTQNQSTTITRIAAASTDTSLSLFELSVDLNEAYPVWSGPYGNVFHTNYLSSDVSEVKKSAELLPKKFAYNWPNPVYSGSTNIRYYLGKSATVKITIVNLAGELVQELQGTNYVGLDNEVPWNISSVQSGIYFAQITATGSGEEASQIVKIAVVK